MSRATFKMLFLPYQTRNVASTSLDFLGLSQVFCQMNKEDVCYRGRPRASRLETFASDFKVFLFRCGLFL